MKKRLYLKDTEAREEGNTFSVIADFEGNEEQYLYGIWFYFQVYLCRYLSGERLP